MSASAPREGIDAVRCYEAGYAQAMQDLTHLATVVNDRRTLEALGRLTRFLEWTMQRVDGESLQKAPPPSAYWKANRD